MKLRTVMGSHRNMSHEFSGILVAVFIHETSVLSLGSRSWKLKIKLLAASVSGENLAATSKMAPCNCVLWRGRI